MKADLDNLNLFEQDVYPKTMEKAKAYLESYSNKKISRPNNL